MKLLQRMGHRPAPPTPQPVVRVQYGCMKNGVVIFVYSTEASMLNDPIYGRSEGATSVGRLTQRDSSGKYVPISGWRPVFNGDLATHRYKVED